VGTAAILRFVRPVCYQDFPQEWLPAELKDENPRGIWRMIEGKLTQEAISSPSLVKTV
jgi:NADP-dependent aldehyde dehydrogenase